MSLWEGNSGELILDSGYPAVVIDWLVDTDALTWARLSRCESSLYWEYYDRSEERCQVATAAAETALRLAPGLAESNESMGC